MLFVTLSTTVDLASTYKSHTDVFTNPEIETVNKIDE